MKHYPILIASMLVAMVAANDFYGSGSRVEELTEANFKAKVLESDEMWLVEFYAPWCGHCQKLKPSFEKVAKTLKGVVKVGAMDMDVHKMTGQKYGVTGFPSIMFFGLDKKKNPSKYEQARESDSIVSYVLDQVTRNVKERQNGKSSGGSGKKNSGGSKGGSGGDHVVVLND